MKKIHLLALSTLLLGFKTEAKQPEPVPLVLSGYENLKNSAVYDDRMNGVKNYLIGPPKEPFIKRIKQEANRDQESIEWKLWFSQIFYVGQRKDEY